MIAVAWVALYLVIVTRKDVRFQVLTAANMKFRFVFWDVPPCKIIHRPDDGGSTYL
jgi:hypothetical protein